MTFIKSTAFGISLALLLPLAGYATGAGASNAEWQPIERDTTIVLTIHDERDQASVDVAAVSAADLMKAVQSSVLAMFIEKGYNIVTDGPADVARVRIGVRSFALNLDKKFWSVKERAATVFSLEAKKGGKTVRKMYRSSSEKRAFRSPFKRKSDLDKKVNAALHDVLDQVAGDRGLEQFLVKG